MKKTWVATIYFLQGLPFSLVRKVASVYFKNSGLSLQQIGMTSLYGIPWTFKFLWAPFVDSISTKRNWVIAMQWLLAALCVVLSICVNLGERAPFVMAFIFLVMAFVSATHDISTDGFYLESLSHSEQAKLSGLQVACYRLALLFGSGVVVVVAGKVSWNAAFLVAGAIFALGAIFHQIFLPKKSIEAGEVKKKEKIHFIAAFKSFVNRPNMHIAISFILLFKLGDDFLFSMVTPFLLDSGMTTAELGFYGGGIASTMSIVGGIVGGWIVGKFGLKKTLWKLALIQNLALPAYALAAYVKPSVPALGALHGFESFIAGLGTAGYVNYLMRQCSTEFRSSHYAVATGLMSLSVTLSGVVSGFLAQRLGYAVFFFIAFLVSIPGMLILPQVTRNISDAD